jgi:hypothetical protein
MLLRGSETTEFQNTLKIKRLPRSLQPLAMTKRDCDTVSLREGME